MPEDASCSRYRGERILRLPAVIARTGLSRSSIYRKIDEGTFPAQVKINHNCVGWHQSAIEDWIGNPRSYVQPFD
ncbi:transcriptional regulator, AlpA family [Sphingomonas laterariae]|uniref:Transcriptional regulator, AlpA family n=1 Tax=Edaphosphingomonas laterariae TaxID=861865 RepID=A0A239J1T8_9SPHN|nr:AlpA family phage regulatory protein [Sphingomonas laterariae]SNS99428.1 transcriptional regulator, AlpA family [Sphingomonas laterariae]